MQKIKNSRFVKNLIKQAEENPVLILGITAALLTASAKLIEAIVQHSYSKTHKKEIDRRIQNSR